MVPPLYQQPFLQHRKSTLYLLICFHIAVIAISNYLVQFPIVFLGLDNTLGAFSFPLVYVATDLTVRIYGPNLARRIIAAVIVPALCISYLISASFYEGHFQGLASLTHLNLTVARIALASFMAYLCGQLLDVTVFNRLRRLSLWIIAPLVSSIFGNALDSVVFFSVAFYKSQDPVMARLWLDIALADYACKIIISFIFMLPVYGALLAYVQHRITKPQPIPA